MMMAVEDMVHGLLLLLLHDEHHHHHVLHLLDTDHHKKEDHHHHHTQPHHARVDHSGGGDGHPNGSQGQHGQHEHGEHICKAKLVGTKKPKFPAHDLSMTSLSAGTEAESVAF